MELLPIGDFLTIGTAVLGAVLGVMNTWHAMNQKRVNLRVKPSYALDPSGQPIGFSIEVTNLSAFPVTIAEVGLTLPKKQRFVIKQPEFIDHGSWPRKLDTRESVSAYFTFDNLVGFGGKLQKAYVRTACGEFRYGTSPALRQLTDILPA
jgi:hypothetical protein